MWDAVGPRRRSCRCSLTAWLRRSDERLLGFLLQLSAGKEVMPLCRAAAGQKSSLWFIVLESTFLQTPPHLHPCCPPDLIHVRLEAQRYKKKNGSELQTSSVLLEMWEKKMIVFMFSKSFFNWAQNIYYSYNNDIAFLLPRSKRNCLVVKWKCRRKRALEEENRILNDMGKKKELNSSSTGWVKHNNESALLGKDLKNWWLAALTDCWEVRLCSPGKHFSFVPIIIWIPAEMFTSTSVTCHY